MILVSALVIPAEDPLRGADLITNWAVVTF